MKRECPFYSFFSIAYEKPQISKKLMREGAKGDRVVEITYKVICNGGAGNINGDLQWRQLGRSDHSRMLVVVLCNTGEANAKRSPRVAVEDEVTAPYNCKRALYIENKIFHFKSHG